MSSILNCIVELVFFSVLRVVASLIAYVDTSQAKNKKWNRMSEFVLRDVELLATLSTLHGQSYPKVELDRLWKLLLLNQFHDVLPGSSIELVYNDSTTNYQDILKSGAVLKSDALEFLLKKLFLLSNEKEKGTQRLPEELYDLCFCTYGTAVRSLVDRLMRTPISLVVFNTLGFARSEVVEVALPGGAKADGFQFAQISLDGDRGLAIVDAKAFSVNVVEVKREFIPVTVKSTAQGFHLENQFVTVSVDANGHLTSMFDKAENRELILPGQLGNKFKMYEDIPLFWDAWDVEVYHLEKGWDAGVGKAAISETGPLRASLVVTHPISKTSTLKQTISLTAASPRLDFVTTVQWNENRKFLKVEFPFDIHSDVATYETAFGIVSRPTHYNTSWDLARFEVCCHKFADLSEFGYGVAVLNDCKYGFAAHGNTMRLSLLRAPKAPDEHCDIGTHEFKYAIYPHKGTFAESNVVEEGLKFNVPTLTRIIPKSDDLERFRTEPFFEVVGARNVIVDTVKRAEDSGEVVVRMYEAYGGRAQFKFVSSLPVASAQIVNLLEEPLEKVEWSGNACALRIKPFQILTIKLQLKK